LVTPKAEAKRELLFIKPATVDEDFPNEKGALIQMKSSMWKWTMTLSLITPTTTATSTL